MKVPVLLVVLETGTTTTEDSLSPSITDEAVHIVWPSDPILGSVLKGDRDLYTSASREMWLGKQEKSPLCPHSMDRSDHTVITLL